MANLIERLDAQLEQLLAAWNIWTTCLVFALLLVLIYPLVTYREPDTHPLLLSRQSNVGMVRQPGESAVYRSLEVPHGLPLRSGLNVKSAGQSKWAPGRDGDIRDIWRRVVTGAPSDNGQSTSHRSKIQTVFGREEIETHDISDLSKQIKIVGQYIKQQGGVAVAIYLPNSIELLLAIFAGSFYGFRPILIPYGIAQDVALKSVDFGGADFLIAAAGTIPLDDVKSHCKDVQQIMWVVEKTSRHMDWNEIDEKITSSVWHEVVEQHSTAETDTLPENGEGDKVPDLVIVWLNKTTTAGEAVSFTQNNIVAGTSAQLSALPSRQRLSHDDIFLPADSLAQPHMLTQTFAALYSGAVVALNSVAGPQVDLATSVAGISPTVIATSAASALKLHVVTKSVVSNGLREFALNSQKRALEAGYMPPTTAFSHVVVPTRAMLGGLPSKLRLLYVFEQLHSNAPPLNSEILTELRAFTGARVIYALAAASVAGTVTQTGFFDYRRKTQGHEEQSHFGAPMSSLEVKLVDKRTHKNTQGQSAIGEVCFWSPNFSYFADECRCM